MATGIGIPEVEASGGTAVLPIARTNDSKVQFAVVPISATGTGAVSYQTVVGTPFKPLPYNDAPMEVDLTEQHDIIIDRADVIAVQVASDNGADTFRLVRVA